MVSLNRRPHFILPLIGLLLAGCGALPTEEANAFRELSAATESAFAGAAQAEEKALREYATREVALGHLSLRSDAQGCRGRTRDTDPEPVDCFLILKGLEQPIEYTPSTPKVRQLLVAIKSYGALMAELAEAKDLEEGKAAAKKAATGVQGLAAVAGVAVPSIVIDLAVDIFGRIEEQKRRVALRGLARLAREPIKVTTNKINVAAAAYQRNIQVGAFYRLAHAETQLAQPGLAAPARREAVNAMFESARDINAARAMKTDFSKLETAHNSLVNALENPEIDLSDVIAEFRYFVEQLKAVEAAFAK